MANQHDTRQLSKFLVAAVALLVLSAVSLFFDAYITSLRSEGLLSGDLRRIIRLSEIFAHGFGIAIVLYLLWVLAPGGRRLIPRVAACAVAPGIVAQFLKMCVERRRPGYYWPEFTDRISDTWIGVLPGASLNFEYVTQSFPSAHAATAVGLALGLSWRFPLGRTAFCSLAFLGAIQRVYSGAHWTSDVFAGAAVGVVVCGFILHGRSLNRLFARIESTNSDADSGSTHDREIDSARSGTSKAA